VLEVCDPKDAKSEFSRKYVYYRFINIAFVDLIFQNYIYVLKKKINQNSNCSSSFFLHNENLC